MDKIKVNYMLGATEKVESLKIKVADEEIDWLFLVWVENN